MKRIFYRVGDKIYVDYGAIVTMADQVGLKATEIKNVISAYQKESMTILVD